VAGTFYITLGDILGACGVFQQDPQGGTFSFTVACIHDAIRIHSLQCWAPAVVGNTVSASFSNINEIQKSTIVSDTVVDSTNAAYIRMTPPPNTDWDKWLLPVVSPNTVVFTIRAPINTIIDLNLSMQQWSNPDDDGLLLVPVTTGLAGGGPPAVSAIYYLALDGPTAAHNILKPIGLPTTF